MENNKLFFNAVKKGDTKTVYSKYLSEDIIDYNPKNIDGKTTLHIASENGHKEIVKLFLNHPKVTDMNIRDKNGQTPMHLAAQEGHIEVLDLLLNHNMVYKNPMDNEGKTPMHVAAYEGHADVIEKLLAHDQGELQCSDICRVFLC